MCDLVPLDNVGDLLFVYLVPGRSGGRQRDRRERHEHGSRSQMHRANSSLDESACHSGNDAPVGLVTDGAIISPRQEAN